MKKGIYIALGIMLISLFAKAQLIPNFGSQRAGLSTLSFLKNDINPRSSALSGASVALSGDGFSIHTNPAAITDVESFNISLSNLSLGAGVQQSFVSMIAPRKNKLSAFGLSLNILNSGPMKVRTEFQPNGTGEKFYVQNLAVAGTYAQKLSDMFSAGISLKYINETIDTYSNSTVSADLSFLYYTDFKDLKFAVLVQNFGGSSSLEGEDLPSDYNRPDPIEPDEYSIPTVFSIGASIVPWKKEKQSLLIAAQLNHPTDNAENYRLGFEYNYHQMLYLRTGIKVNVEGQAYPSFGFAIRHRTGAHPLSISYGVNPTEFLGLRHNVGVSVSFNNKGRDEK